MYEEGLRSRSRLRTSNFLRLLSIITLIFSSFQLEAVYFVAECNGCITGHAFLEILPLQSLKHIAELNIAVHKGFQNRGIGTQLMDRIIEWAKESESVEKIELNVRASNAQAIALYKKMGFLEEGCLKHHVKTGSGYIDDILMALHVKGPLPEWQARI